MNIVTRTLAADHTTPVRAYAALRAQAPDMPSFLLESVLPGEPWGRYSIAGYLARAEALYPAAGDPFQLLAGDLASAETPEGLAARFTQARVGYLGYDAVGALHELEPWPTEASFGRFMHDATVVLFDNLHHTMTIAGRSVNVVNRCEWEMSHGPELPVLHPPDPAGVPEHLDVSMDDATYGERVLRAKEHIAAGDALQVVLARTYRSPRREADPLDVYRALRMLSPSPYLYFLDFPERRMEAGARPLAEALSIAGASPETMVRVAGRRMTLRPIAGTRPRGATEPEDRALAAELLADPKERAEHVMLIDLARNDVGRVCTPGSVEVTSTMQVERFSHVMHLVSEVQGELREGVTGVDAARAAFPAGTLSGAPKVRATQIIRELEDGPRDIYGGAIGYAMPDGDIDLAIAIRTVVARGGQLEVTAGAGIVHGSVPELEARETRSKARAALAAIRAAQDAVLTRRAADSARQAALAARKAKLEAAAREHEPRGDGGSGS